MHNEKFVINKHFNFQWLLIYLPIKVASWSEKEFSGKLLHKLGKTVGFDQTLQNNIKI